jgi:hypothetical protein
MSALLELVSTLVVPKILDSGAESFLHVLGRIMLVIDCIPCRQRHRPLRTTIS